MLDIPQRAIARIWKSMAEAVEVVDFQSPVPGAMANFSEKAQLVVSSYHAAGLLEVAPGEKNHRKTWH